MIQKISGEVIHGNALGRTIWFPTANIAYEGEISDSVFIINVILNSHIYSGIGSNMVRKWVFEAHIFDFDDDIYGETIEIILLKKIRDNIKLNSLEEIKEQISKDQELAQNTQLNVLTFGSFDLVHEGHKYYLGEAKKLWNNLLTIIATDKNIEKIKWTLPQHSQTERFNEVSDLWIADEVFMGSEDHPMTWVERFKPHIICLWYDQWGKFVDHLPDKISKLWLETQILRIAPYHPETYKSSILKQKNKE